MAELNHTIVWCGDKQKSADFLTHVLGLPPARTFFHFLVDENGGFITGSTLSINGGQHMY